MQVTAFLKEVQLRLITHEEFVASVADVDSRRVDLITVAQAYSVDVTTDTYRD